MAEEKHRKIIFRDKGEAYVFNWANQLEAIGGIEVFCSPQRVSKLIEEQKMSAMKFPPIMGEIAVEDGGEYYIKGFHNPMEAIGFIVTWMNPQALTNLMNQLSAVLPTKFQAMQDSAKATHEKVESAIDDMYWREKYGDKPRPKGVEA